MKALFINLDHEVSRRAFQIDQAARLGIELLRISAVTSEAVAPPPDATYWHRWQRPLRHAEMATLLSHRKAWQHVQKTMSPCLILEDDAWLMPSSASFLAEVAGLTGIDHLSLEVRNRFKIVGKPYPNHNGLRRLVLDRSGAAAYVLWPEGARKLIARTDLVPGLADAVLMETPGLKSWQADPAHAIQIDMATSYGLTAPINVSSAISNSVRPGRGTLPFRLRRLKENLRQSARMLHLAIGAERRKIPLSTGPSTY